jgi:hypothetical protein
MSMSRRRPSPALVGAAALLAWASTACAASSGPDAEAAWPVVGRQGVVRLVIVPAAAARDRDAYARQIERLCEPERTCFLNFYTNSTGAPLGVPLPDAVADEVTAVFRRSSKQMAEGLRWSCRLQVDPTDCF